MSPHKCETSVLSTVLLKHKVLYNTLLGIISNPSKYLLYNFNLNSVYILLKITFGVVWIWMHSQNVVFDLKGVML